MNKYQMAILAMLASAGITQTPAANATDEQWIESMNNAVNAFKTKATEAENKVKVINQARAKDLLAALKAAGKISNETTPDQEAMIVNQATDNYDMVNAMFGMVQAPAAETIVTGANGAPVGKTVDINTLLHNGGKAPENKGGIPQDRAGWDVTKWAKEDPSGLQNLAKTHPKEYQQLLNKVEDQLIADGVKSTE